MINSVQKDNRHSYNNALFIVSFIIRENFSWYFYFSNALSDRILILTQISLLKFCNTQN